MRGSFFRRKMARFIQLLKQTANSWLEHKAAKMGAALAYYAALSLAPLLMIVLSILSFAFGEEAARGQLLEQVSSLVGKEGAAAAQMIIEASAKQETTGWIATIAGFLTLLFGASGVFGELQDSLNTIWEVPPKTTGGVVGYITARFLSFVMVLGTGFLLLVSLLLSAAVAALSKFMVGYLPMLETMGGILNSSISVIVMAVLFAMIFRVLPDVEIAWRDVAIGALGTAVLLEIGKLLLGLYLGRSAIGSSYGAAGSLVVVLFWVFYSSQILFFGAEFTRAFAKSCGTHCMKESEPQKQ